MLGSFAHGVLCPYPRTQNREFVSSAGLDMTVWPISSKVHLAKLHFGVVHLVESSSNLMPRLDGIAAEISYIVPGGSRWWPPRLLISTQMKNRYARTNPMFHDEWWGVWFDFKMQFQTVRSEAWHGHHLSWKLDVLCFFQVCERAVRGMQLWFCLRDAYSIPWQFDGWLFLLWQVVPRWCSWSLFYVQAPVIQSIHCPVEPAVNLSQAPNWGSSDERDTYAPPILHVFLEMKP